MAIKFMNTKERCLHCGEKLSDEIKLESRLSVEIEGGNRYFCDAKCCNEWVDGFKYLK